MLEESVEARIPVMRDRRIPRSWDRLASKLEDAAAQGDRDGMSPIVGVQLLQNAFHVSLDGLFRDRELAGHPLVRVAEGNRAQHLYLALGKRILAEMRGKVCGDLCRNAASACVNLPDRVHQFREQLVLQ